MSPCRRRCLLTNLFLWSSLIPILLAACLRADTEQLPQRRDVAPKSNPSFAQDIQPILSEYCIKCHEARDAHAGLRLDTYAGVMKGSSSHPVVVPGQPQESRLLKAIQRETEPSLWMPFHQEPLTPNRIHNIESWIARGAPNN